MRSGKSQYDVKHQSENRFTGRALVASVFDVIEIDIFYHHKDDFRREPIDCFLFIMVNSKRRENGLEVTYQGSMTYRWFC